MRAEEKILSAIQKHGRSYYAQIKEQTGLSHSSLQNALAKLENERLIQKEMTKANTFYMARKTLQTALKFAEQDNKAFENLNSNVRVPLKEFLMKIPKEIAFIILFGSAARKTEAEESDIDLLIVLNSFREKTLKELYGKEMIAACEKAKRDAEALSLHRISLAFTTVEEFTQNNDHLVIQARKTGFPIEGHIRYYEVLRDASRQIL